MKNCGNKKTTQNCNSIRATAVASVACQSGKPLLHRENKPDTICKAIFHYILYVAAF